MLQICPSLPEHVTANLNRLLVLLQLLLLILVLLLLLPLLLPLVLLLSPLLMLRLLLLLLLFLLMFCLVSLLLLLLPPLPSRCCCRLALKMLPIPLTNLNVKTCKLAEATCGVANDMP